MKYPIKITKINHVIFFQVLLRELIATFCKKIRENMIKISFLLLVVLFLSSVVYANDLSTYIDEGDKLHEKYDNVNALKQYEKAYNLDPNNYEALFKVTRTYNDAAEHYKEERNFEEAEKYINTGIKFAEEFQKKFPDSAAAYAYLALSYGNLAMYMGNKDRIKLAKKIEENAKKSIALNPNEYLPYVILGIYYRELASLNWVERLLANTFFGEVPKGTYEDSERMLKKALQFEPDMIVAHFQLARTYRRMERENDVKRLLQKVINLPERNFRDVYSKQKAKRMLAGM
jgi:tetratricopeptide (TPR) repeat protein